MIFNSLEFALFLCACLLLTWMLPHRAQNRLLLLASYVFYAAWDWRFLGLIVLSTVIDYTVGLALERSHAPRRRRWLVSASIAANLSILGAFKYAGFFADSLRELAGLAGLELSRVSLDVVLPVGISFYTFQTLSYTIDIYRGRLQPTRHFLDFALFVAFFPQLVAGPIERATNLLPQILAPRRFRWSSAQPASSLPQAPQGRCRRGAHPARLTPCPRSRDFSPDARSRPSREIRRGGLV